MARELTPEEISAVFDSVRRSLGRGIAVLVRDKLEEGR